MSPLPVSAGSAHMSGRDHTLQTLTASLWDTVTRIADGRDLDKQDLDAIDTAHDALLGQLQLLRFAAGGSTSDIDRIGYADSSDALASLFRAAYIQVDGHHASVVDLLPQIVDALEGMRHGDTAVAARYVDVVERVALLSDVLAVD